MENNLTGEGSQKTAVLSVIKLTGNGLKTFNSTLGDKFIAAMAQTYGELLQPAP